MIILTYSNGKYSYDEQADESVFNENECLLYSHNSLGKDKWIAKLYDGRVEICCRGGEWKKNDYALSVDGVGITSGMYCGYMSYYKFKYYGIDRLVDYLNLIENKGIDYLFDQYEKVIREDYQRVLDLKPYLESHWDVIQANGGTQKSNMVIQYLHQLTSEHQLLSEQLRKIETAKLLRNK